MEMKSRPGFTLMEILVVLAILGVLMGTLIPKLFKQFADADEKKVELRMQSLTQALLSYKMHIGIYPNTKEGLKALLANPRPNDDRFTRNKDKWPYVQQEEIEDDKGIEFTYHCPPERFKDKYKNFEILWEVNDEVKRHAGS